MIVRTLWDILVGPENVYIFKIYNLSSFNSII